MSAVWTMQPRRWRLPVLALWLLMMALALAAVPAVANDKKGGRTLATVNGVDITEREVELVYERSGFSDPTIEAADARKRVILADLVRAEALAQWMLENSNEDANETALETKLIRRQMLATRAERASKTSVQPLTPQQLQGLITANPLIFAERRQYTLEEVQIATNDGSLFTRLDDAVRKGGATLDAAQRLAMDAGATTERRVISMGSEAIPKPVMEALATAQIGQIFVVQSAPDRGWLLAVRAAVQAPLVGEEAMRVATALAAEQQRIAAIQVRRQEVLERARITYSGDIVALSAAAARRAADARAAAPPPTPASGAASGTAAGPLVVSPPVQEAELPRGRDPFSKRAMAKTAAIGLATGLAGLLALLAVFTVVRFGYETFWLPHVWPLRQPEPTPTLLLIVLESLLHPKRLSLMERAAKWLVNLGFLAGVLALAVAASAASRQVPWWALATCAAMGWIVGVLLLYRFAKSNARQVTRGWRGVSAITVQGACLLLAGSVRWL